MSDYRIKNVDFCNRRKQLFVEYKNGTDLTCHYGQLGIQGRVIEVHESPETDFHTISLEYEGGGREYIPYDAPLMAVKDPDYMFQLHIEYLVADLNEEIQKKKISKRFLAEQLGTSPNQIYRLLDPEISNKNLRQLYRIAALLGLEICIGLKERVA